MKRLCAMTAMGLFAAAAAAPLSAQNGDVHPDFPDRGTPTHPTLPLFAGDGADACRAGATQIRITLPNIYAEGIVKLDFYKGEKDFLDKKGKIRRIRVAAQNAPQRICADVPGPGTYAVASYHDLDGDRKLDKKWNYKPKEPYALSNNPNITELRMPKFSEAAFDVPASGMDITLIYYGKKAGDMDGSAPE